ncbi:MAG: carboxypeptidase regulatory-like domain-containing protein, partial [Clostridia bacterium]|nr:carboxypeptidase regulatory-like domain-containing protein [Clostridia bacterium]
VGYADDTYTVTFYNRAQNEAEAPVAISTQEGIAAGGAATDPAAGKSEAELKQLLAYPTYMEKSFNKWGFDGWSIDFSNVQKDLQVYPKFTPVPKQYHINYFNYDGTAAEGLNSEYCLFGGYPKESSTPSRDGGLAYNYLFDCWSLKANVDPTVNEDDAKYLLDWSLGLALPTDETLGQVKGQPGYIDLYGKETDESIELNVYAYYTRHNKEYPLSLTVVDRYGARVAGADVQVLGANGQLLDQTIAQTDENGNYTGRFAPAVGKTDAEGKLFLRLPYQTEYTIQVSHGDYEGAKIKKTNIGEMQSVQGVTIQLEDPAQYNEENKARCTCACHSFIGGLWVVGLNLMYTLFKVKYVCCYDMYATHGSRLAYSA